MSTSAVMPGITTVYLRWAATRTLLYRGYWLVASLYLVVDANLSPFQLIFLGTAQARWEQIGAAAGLIGLGLTALLIGRGTAMVVAGVATVLLGLYIVARFTEDGFAPTRSRRWQQSTIILRRGLARHDREILLIVMATVLINGAAEAYGRLYPRQLVDLGFPERSEPIV